MTTPFWKRCTAVLVLAAFFAAALVPFLPQPAAAEPCAMMMAGPSAMDGDQPSKDDHASKDQMPPCGSGLSCMLMVALPELFEPSSTQITWTPIRYWAVPSALAGLSVPPDYSPPIVRT
jgi:hypothetical protein